MKHEGWSFAERWFLWYGMIANSGALFCLFYESLSGQEYVAWQHLQIVCLLVVGVFWTVALASFPFRWLWDWFRREQAVLAVIGTDRWVPQSKLDGIRTELRAAPIAVLKLREQDQTIKQLRKDLAFAQGRYDTLADLVLNQDGCHTMLEKATEVGKCAASRVDDTNLLDSRDETGGRG